MWGWGKHSSYLPLYHGVHEEVIKSRSSQKLECMGEGGCWMEWGGKKLTSQNISLQTLTQDQLVVLENLFMLVSIWP